MLDLGATTERSGDEARGTCLRVIRASFFAQRPYSSLMRNVLGATSLRTGLVAVTLLGWAAACGTASKSGANGGGGDDGQPGSAGAGNRAGTGSVVNGAGAPGNAGSLSAGASAGAGLGGAPSAAGAPPVGSAGTLSAGGSGPVGSAGGPGSTSTGGNTGGSGFYRMERLSRGLTAVTTTGGVYVGWRMYGFEYDATTPSNVSYNVYRDGAKIANVTDSTNYQDKDGKSASTYTVRPVIG